MNTLRDLLNIIRTESANNGSASERKAVESLSGAFTSLLEALDLAEAPTVVARTHDVMTAFVIAFRIDEALWTQGILIDKVDKDPKKKDKVINPLVEQSAKAHERLRKAMKEVEDVCAKAGKPINEGLPDKVRELMKKAELAIEKMFEEKSDTEDAA